jgi:hypothetical protein
MGRRQWDTLVLVLAAGLFIVLMLGMAWAIASGAVGGTE